MLGNSGCLGSPDEYFCPQNRARFVRENHLQEALESNKLVQAIIAGHTSESGIFSAKLFPDNLDWILSAHGADPGSVDNPLLRHIFPEPVFIRIDRRDKLAQAISLVKSQQTSLWHSDAAPLFRRLKPYYDRERISRAKRILELDSQRWDNFFRRCGIQPLALNYEDFSSDLRGTVQRIFDYLQLDSRADEIPLPAKRILRDSTSEDWKKRYEEETRLIQGVDSIEFIDRQRPAVEIRSNLGERLAANFPVQIDFTVKNLLPSDLYCLGDAAWKGRFFLVLEMVSPSTGEKVQATTTFPSHWGTGEELNISMILNSPRKAGIYSVFVKVLQRNNGFLESLQPFHQTVEVVDPVRSVYEAFFGRYEERPDQWVYSPGFGYSFWKRFPWVLHEDHGWIQIMGKSANRLMLSDQSLGEWEIVSERDGLKYYSKRYGEFKVSPGSDRERTVYPAASGEAIRLPRASIEVGAGLFGESPEAIPGLD